MLPQWRVERFNEPIFTLRVIRFPQKCLVTRTWEKMKLLRVFERERRKWIGRWDSRGGGRGGKRSKRSSWKDTDPLKRDSYRLLLPSTTSTCYCSHGAAFQLNLNACVTARNNPNGRYTMFLLLGDRFPRIPPSFFFRAKTTRFHFESWDKNIYIYIWEDKLSLMRCRERKFSLSND